MEVGGAGAGNYDVINVTGNVVLNGRLTVPLINGFVPSGSHSLPILTGASITGSFSSVALSPGYSVSYTSTSVLLNYGTVLPVNFESFEAVENAGKARLTWQVTEEAHVQVYEVEKSLNGTDYQKIGFVNVHLPMFAVLHLSSPRFIKVVKIKNWRSQNVTSNLIQLKV